MDTQNDRLERFSTYAGLLAVLLWVVALAVSWGEHIGLPGGLPEEGADEVQAYFSDNEGRVIGASWLFMLGSLSFLWFVCALRSRLVQPGGQTDSLATIALGGGVATASFILAMPIGGLVAALQIDNIEASTAEALNAVETVFFIGAELAAIVFLAATAAVWLRTRAVASWWSWTTIALAVWLAILPIGWVGLLVGLPLWTIVTSLLLRQPQRTAPVSSNPRT